MTQSGVLSYTLKRLGLFAATLAVGYLSGLRDLFLVVLALLVSGVLSLVLLNRDRDKASAQAVGIFQRLNRRIGGAAEREDTALDLLSQQSYEQPGEKSVENRETEH
jgi:hypothetical protein